MSWVACAAWVLLLLLVLSCSCVRWLEHGWGHAVRWAAHVVWVLLLVVAETQGWALLVLRCGCE